MTIYTTFTYLIGWTAHNKWYYGVRFGKNSNPEDLWNTYFTSSKYVAEFRKQHGEPDVVQIRKIFTSEESIESVAIKALDWESKVLRKLNVLYDDKWLNKNIAGNYRTLESIPNPLKGTNYIDVYGEDKAEMWRKNISNSLKENWNSEEGILRKERFRINAEKEVLEGKTFISNR